MRLAALQKLVDSARAQADEAHALMAARDAAADAARQRAEHEAAKDVVRCWEGGSHGAWGP